ncbi:MAG: hypothetical protein Q8J64_04175 [Thermodesulfovibrionales bacterium]|nr:hypothetical protein [Thermodesulfovibrionales bacterium]
MKIKDCFVVISFAVLFLLFAQAASEAASVYLKNGSVIKGVASYKKVNGKFLLYVYGGLLEIPEADILRIEDVGEPVKVEPRKEEAATGTAGAKPPEKPAEDPMRAQRIEELKRFTDKVNGRLAEIQEKEDGYNALKKDYDEARLRIEVLFQRGRKAAAAAGKDISVWFQFLSPQEREWSQINSLRKQKLEKEMADLEKELKPMLEEKESLLEEKKSYGEELAGLEESRSP